MTVPKIIRPNRVLRMRAVVDEGSAPDPASEFAALDAHLPRHPGTALALKEVRS